jgi:hypothetical protein
MDLGMMKIDPDTNKAVFGMQTKTLSGINLLAQLVMMTLLTTPGSDTLDYERGAGMESLIGKFNLDVTAEVTRIINVAKDEIMSNQVGLNISSEEKLNRISLVSLVPNEDTATLDVKIRIENEVGRTRDVVI